jgi:acetyltransferase-like isoleucine patch superfamily enzyme
MIDEKISWFRPNVTVVCDATIGKKAMVGAGAVVTKDVKDGVLVMGNHARVKNGDLIIV